MAGHGSSFALHLVQVHYFNTWLDWPRWYLQRGKVFVKSSIILNITNFGNIHRQTLQIRTIINLPTTWVTYPKQLHKANSSPTHRQLLPPAPHHQIYAKALLQLLPSEECNQPRPSYPTWVALLEHRSSESKTALSNQYQIAATAAPPVDNS